eukprot:gb/GECG01000847.1/.p1 GENE.gb/GECG01000847.1/~~gb/GECG01000847.1/.p1  ORF type:complete len:142 (+),score=6.34 gb/GECG01000847.1/:1-426(+)
MSSVPRNVTPWMSHGPRNIKTYLNWIKDEKKFLAPNLKELHLWKFASMKGQGHPSNRITFDIAKYHLLAFRWMNPNALVYLHEARVEEKTPSYAEFTLCKWRAPNTCRRLFHLLAGLQTMEGKEGLLLIINSIHRKWCWQK